MTIRKLLVLASVGCLLVAAISAAAVDVFGLADHSIREDSEGWGWLGVAFLAASTYPAGIFDRRYGG